MLFIEEKPLITKYSSKYKLKIEFFLVSLQAKYYRY